MRDATRLVPDWRDASAYAPLRDAERPLFAWEWLRRDPSYQAAEATASGTQPPHIFGLVAFEPPDRAVPDARPLWRSDAVHGVLQAEVSREALPADRLDLVALNAFACLKAGAEGDHLLLSNGVRTIRIDGPHGLFEAGASLAFRIAGLISAGPAVDSLRRLIALVRDQRFGRALNPREARADRWILLLRTADALAEGADQRAIAEHLLGLSAADPGWRLRDPSLRSCAQRLVRSARAMAAGGYRSFLGANSQPIG